ncbi:hypothetical protein K3G39_17635, partial [Pontibacter sp. HSC-14F20]|uniref:hypothetical protein n=1 Tax=Pontibacter sp. HSC-14F20 TaxID=2864136 RepID=UPI001C72F9DC
AQLCPYQSKYPEKSGNPLPETAESIVQYPSRLTSVGPARYQIVPRSSSGASLFRLKTHNGSHG